MNSTKTAKNKNKNQGNDWKSNAIKRSRNLKRFSKFLDLYKLLKENTKVMVKEKIGFRLGKEFRLSAEEKEMLEATVEEFRGAFSIPEDKIKSLLFDRDIQTPLEVYFPSIDSFDEVLSDLFDFYLHDIKVMLGLKDSTLAIFAPVPPSEYVSDPETRMYFLNALGTGLLLVLNDVREGILEKVNKGEGLSSVYPIIYLLESSVFPPFNEVKKDIMSSFPNLSERLRSLHNLTPNAVFREVERSIRHSIRQIVFHIYSSFHIQNLAEKFSKEDIQLLEEMRDNLSNMERLISLVEVEKKLRALDSDNYLQRSLLLKEKWSLVDDNILEKLREESINENKKMESQKPTLLVKGDIIHHPPHSDSESKRFLKENLPTLHKRIMKTPKAQRSVDPKLVKEYVKILDEGIPKEFLFKCLTYGLKSPDGIRDFYLSRKAITIEEYTKGFKFSSAIRKSIKEKNANPLQVLKFVLHHTGLAEKYGLDTAIIYSMGGRTTAFLRNCGLLNGKGEFRKSPNSSLGQKIIEEVKKAFSDEKLFFAGVELGKATR